MGLVYKICSLRVCEVYFFFLCDFILFFGVCCFGDLRIFFRVFLRFFILFLIFKENKYFVVYVILKYLIVIMYLKKCDGICCSRIYIDVDLFRL